MSWESQYCLCGIVHMKVGHIALLFRKYRSANIESKTLAYVQPCHKNLIWIDGTHIMEFWGTTKMKLIDNLYLFI